MDVPKALHTLNTQKVNNIMKYQVVYTPKIENEIVVASFDTYADADAHMQKIKKVRSRAYAHHYINVSEEEQSVEQ